MLCITVCCSDIDLSYLYVFVLKHYPIIGMNRVLLDGLKSRSIDFDVTKQNLKNTSLNSAGYICFG